MLYIAARGIRTSGEYPDMSVVIRFVVVVGLFASWFAARGATAADASVGEKVFKSQCSICHSNQPGRNITGPSLFGVVGRQTGKVEGFHYSTANVSARLTWDAANLDRYIQSPRSVVPGTAMPYPGLKDDEKRADLIAYLATLH
jgi:cytochrome c2